MKNVRTTMLKFKINGASVGIQILMIRTYLTKIFKSSFKEFWKQLK